MGNGILVTAPHKALLNDVKLVEKTIQTTECLGYGQMQEDAPLESMLQDNSVALEYQHQFHIEGNIVLQPGL